jgi:hypothetical protein
LKRENYTFIVGIARWLDRLVVYPTFRKFQTSVWIYACHSETLRSLQGRGIIDAGAFAFQPAGKARYRLRDFSPASLVEMTMGG